MNRIGWAPVLLFALAACVLWAAAGFAAVGDAPDRVDLSGDWKFHTDPTDRGVQLGWQKPGFDDGDWTSLYVPSFWEDEGITKRNPDWTRDDEDLPYSGYAWYRREVTVPSAWRGGAVHLVIGGIGDEDWTYVNGESVGDTTGQIPTADRPQKRDYLLPAEVIRWGQPNLIAVRVCNVVGRGGIYGEPVELTVEWPEEPGAPVEPGEHEARERPALGREIHVAAGETRPGDVVSMGGDVRVDGHVEGSVVVVGADLYLGDRAIVDRDVFQIGGRFEKAPGAVIHGQQVRLSDLRSLRRLLGIAAPARPPLAPWARRWARFWRWLVGGAVLAAIAALLAPRRIETMATFARDSAGKAFLVGLVALALLPTALVILVVTIVGILLIPAAVLCAIVAIFAGYAASALAVGRGLHIQQQVLAAVVGAALLAVGALIPYVGWIIPAVACAVGLGSLILTGLGRKHHWLAAPRSSPPAGEGAGLA